MGEKALTQRIVDSVPLGSGYLPDEQVKGLMLLAHRTRKTYCVQRRVNGRSVRVSIGDASVMKLAEARKRALQLLAAMSSGADPNAQRRQDRARTITLGEALDLYVSARSRAPRTLQTYAGWIERHLARWREKELRQLGEDRRAVLELHRRITRESGPQTANNVLGLLRATYNRALRQHPDLPPNPVVNVDFHPKNVRTAVIPPQELAAWFKAVDQLSPIRRMAYLFLLLTGSRRTAACEARWEHLSAEGVLRFPTPKGGAKRAFDLPLPAWLLRELRAYRQWVDRSSPFAGTPWLFPAISLSGHLKAFNDSDPRLANPHTLRRTFASIAAAIGVPHPHVQYILNHSTRSVTDQYIQLRAFDEAIRESMNAVTRFLLEAWDLREEGPTRMTAAFPVEAGSRGSRPRSLPRIRHGTQRVIERAG